jgi:hypothetical protein
MRKQWMFLPAVCVFLVLGLTGCDKSNPTDVTTSDKNAMMDIVSNDALFQSDQVLLNDGDPTSTVSYSMLSKTGTAIIPRTWGRKIESFNRSVDFSVLSDTTAEATVTHTLQGFVWIRARYTPTDTLQTIKKNFTETIVRLVKFVRVNRTNDPQKNWKISEVSAIKGGTTASQITITQVKFFTSTDTVVITDPNATFLKMEKGHRGFIPDLSMDPNTPLRAQVTVISAAPDSDFVSAHRPLWYLGRWIYHAPMLLVSSTANGDGTYTRVYEHSWKGAWVGRHNMMVSAITRATILDDTTPVSSQVWGLPFIVE